MRTTNGRDSELTPKRFRAVLSGNIEQLITSIPPRGGVRLEAARALLNQGDTMNISRYSFSSATSKGLNRRVFLQGTCQFAAGAAASLVLPFGARHSITASAATPEATSAVVDTANGKVRGAVVDGINVFKGLTYGASTSGPNRFMPPQKPEPWTGVRDAFEFGPISPQRNPKVDVRHARPRRFMLPASRCRFSPILLECRKAKTVWSLISTRPASPTAARAAGDGLVARRRLFARFGVRPGV